MAILTRRGRLAGLLIGFSLAWCSTAEGEPADFMIRAVVSGDVIEGLPLAWTRTQMFLLGRDGRLHEFDPREARNSRKAGGRFFGYSMFEMKHELCREFGKSSEITTTQHYIVVHPQGQRSEWAERFEKLYRSFHRYFRVRGFDPQEPPYPLVAVVFSNQADYFAYASQNGSTLHPGTLGHYEPDSNRVFLFDTRESGGDWTLNAETIIHEATHQTAFNCGIHRRFTDTPRWVVEGLATMYEARGVYDSRLSDTRKDRTNRDRLRNFQEFARTRRPAGFLAQLIADDDAFRSDPIGAYAEAWALTFFLAETRPRQYAKYLARTADRELFTAYPAAERVADFQDAVHPDLRWLEAQFLSFMEDVL